MKKWMIGLTCGAVFSFATGALASSGMEAILFPSEIKFHGFEGVSEIDGRDTPVLNYQNSVYVPLRSFAETMGARVHYKGPEGEALPQIDMYPNISISESQLIYHDEENYVSIGYIQPVSEYEKIGIVKVHKDLANKVLVLEAYDENGNRVGSSSYVHIYGQDAAPPQAGDIRSFRTQITVDHERIHSYKVKVYDLVRSVNLPGITMNYGNPVHIQFGPPRNYKIADVSNPVIQGPYGEIRAGLDQFVGYLNRGEIALFSWQVYNSSNSNIIVEPFDIEFVVHKLHEDQTETVVFRKKIQTISGLWKSKDGYVVLGMPWDLTDDQGKPLEPGTYRIVLQVPETIRYKIEGSDEQKTYEPFVRFNNIYANIE
jgi:hypothetical protein